MSPRKKPKENNPNAGSEKAALERYNARGLDAPAAPRIKVIGGKKFIMPDHPDERLACKLLMEALGTVSAILRLG